MKKILLILTLLSIISCDITTENPSTESSLSKVETQEIKDTTGENYVLKSNDITPPGEASTSSYDDEFTIERALVDRNMKSSSNRIYIVTDKKYGLEYIYIKTSEEITIVPRYKRTISGNLNISIEGD